MEKELLIRLDPGRPDDLRVLERENVLLRDELERLDAVGGAQPLSTGNAPKDKKATEAFDADSIVVRLAASGGVLACRVGVLPACIRHPPRHSHAVWHGEDTSALKSLLPDQQRALEAFPARRIRPAN
jgi:hypothetical protein